VPLLTVVGDVGSGINLSDHFPMLLESDGNKFGLAAFTKLLGAPILTETRRRPPDLFLKFGFQL
jgi:hypothetical protein